MALVKVLKFLLDRAKSHKIKILTIFKAIEQLDRLAGYLNAIFMTKDNPFDENGVLQHSFTSTQSKLSHCFMRLLSDKVLIGNHLKVQELIVFLIRYYRVIFATLAV
jgi:hypothetical protein